LLTLCASVGAGDVFTLAGFSASRATILISGATRGEAPGTARRSATDGRAGTVLVAETSSLSASSGLAAMVMTSPVLLA
jgi:hypothetical protein